MYLQRFLKIEIMDRNLKLFISVLLVTIIMTQKRICQHLGFGQSKLHAHEVSIVEKSDSMQVADTTVTTDDYFVNDSIYRWHEQLFDWVTIKENEILPPPIAAAELQLGSPPIEVEWKLLMDIQYRLKHFAAIEMEMFAPVFSDAVEALGGKEVIIKGYVIPFDEKGELLALSVGPFSSCFFCGKASPASVISVHLRDKGQHYTVDELRGFRGVLRLNQSDPNEFYYILENAF